jgi:hypothetical protein
MPKTCKYNACTYPQWGGGYCRWHQWNREKYNKPFKPPSQIKRINSRKKVNNGLKAPKQLLKESWGFTSQVELFKYVWSNAPTYICQFTGEDLSKIKGQRWFSCFLHILRKGNYTYFKLNPSNLVLGSPEFHTCVDNWEEKYRTEHPTWKFDDFFKMQEDMKVKYEKFKEDNLL